MATMITEVYDAFLKAGTPEPEARKAAEAATYDPRLAKMESRVDQLTWMVGFNLALTMAVLLKLFLN